MIAEKKSILELVIAVSVLITATTATAIVIGAQTASATLPPCPPYCPGTHEKIGKELDRAKMELQRGNTAGAEMVLDSAQQELQAHSQNKTS